VYRWRLGWILGDRFVLIGHRGRRTGLTRDDRLNAHLALSAKEAFRQGNRGPAHDARIAYRDWGFDLTDVPVPTVTGGGHVDLAGWDDILAACRDHR
jgi:hypothetical protein